MAGKQLEAVSGLVERVNAQRNGIPLERTAEWLNVSRFRPLDALPEPGQRVEVQVERTDRGAWIGALEVLDRGQVHQLRAPRRPPAAGRGRSEAELRTFAAWRA